MVKKINLSTYYYRIPEINKYFIKKEDIATNLTTNDDTKVLSAKQGKWLKDNKIETAGSGLSKNGIILNHSNSVSALTSSSLKKIKHDAQGHITGTENVSASDLPSHTHDDRYYTETEMDTKLNGKANSSHTHTKSQITDFPSTMTPSSHTHGNITNDGVISNQASKNVVTDANGKITTEAKPTIPTGSSTATDIKMNGTQSAGSSSNFAKADHVHPTDTSRAAANHNHDGTYLKSYTPPTGSTSQAGIVKLNSATNSTSTSEAATPSAVKSAYDLANHKTVTLTKLSTAF